MPFPCSYFFVNWIGQDGILFEQFENYQKRSFRNKYTVLSANGLLDLSIPLEKGKHQSKPIRDVQISYEENWQKRHLQAIRSAYGKSAYFEHYFPLLEEAFHQAPTSLFDFNEKMILWVLDMLQMSIPLIYTTGFGILNGTRVEGFSAANLKGSTIRVYPQVFEEKFGFFPHVSILDIIFCLGPESKYHLIKSTPS